MELSIVMPCLNEAETLATCVSKAQGYLQRSGVDGEVVVADNGSTDGSQDIARAAGARVVDVPMKGYGAALTEGIRASRGTYVIMGDSDDSYDFSSLDLFVEALRAGNDLVMGNRFAGGIEPGAMPPLHKYLGNPVLSSVGRVFFRTHIRDFHCGLRGFNRQSMLDLHLQSPGMEFASEMVVKATLARLRVVEVPTKLHPDGRSRPPHLRSWRDGWRHLRFLLLFSPRWLFLYPGLVLFVVGLIGLGVLATTPITIGDFGFDVNTMVVCSGFAVLGYMSMWFAVLSRTFADREGLLPRSDRVDRFRAWFPLETALLVAGGCVVFGLAGLVLAVIRWNFEPQDVDSLRLVVPSTTLLVLGVQTALSSLLLSVLMLPSARPEPFTLVPNQPIDQEPADVRS